MGAGNDEADREEEGTMSQEERDARLGLTGLTGAEREARIRLLTEEIERKVAAAKSALQGKRAGRADLRPPEEGTPAFSAPENG